MARERELADFICSWMNMQSHNRHFNLWLGGPYGSDPVFYQPDMLLVSSADIAAVDLAMLRFELNESLARAEAPCRIDNISFSGAENDHSIRLSRVKATEYEEENVLELESLVI